MARAPIRADRQSTDAGSAAPDAPRMVAPHGRAVALGRDGQPIYRQTSMGSNDPYAIDPSLIPPGWVYEWKRHSLYNAIDHTHLAKLSRVGRWTPVPAERHEGVFMAPGVKGSIIHDGLILMERPIELHREAVQDEKREADERMRRAKVERGLAAASAGIDTRTRAARAATYMRQEAVTAGDLQAMADVPRGAYDYERNTID